MLTQIARAEESTNRAYFCAEVENVQVRFESRRSESADPLKQCLSTGLVFRWAFEFAYCGSWLIETRSKSRIDPASVTLTKQAGLNFAAFFIVTPALLLAQGVTACQYEEIRWVSMG